MDPSQSREIYVKYKEHGRKVHLENDTYQALLDGFIYYFGDVLPFSEEKAREMVRFQKCDSTDKDCVDIPPGESITGVYQVRVKFSDLLFVELRDSHIYNLWSIGSYQGNGYLRRVNDQTLAADGDGIKYESEWKAHQVSSPGAIYWKFSDPGETKVMAIKNGQVVLEDMQGAGQESHFLPTKNGEHYTWSPRGKENSNRFVGADGRAAVKLILNQNPKVFGKKNPVPQTLFTLFYLRK